MNDDWRSLPVDKLDLTVRTANALNYADIATIGQIFQQWTPRKFERLRNFGRMSWANLLSALRKAGVPEEEIDKWLILDSRICRRCKGTGKEKFAFYQ